MAIAVRCPIDGTALANMTWNFRDPGKLPTLPAGDHAHADGAATVACVNGHTWKLTLYMERVA